MNGEYVQNLRHKLQKRVRRLNSTDYESFHIVLKQFWAFVQSQPILSDILNDLGHRYPSAQQDADSVFDKQALFGETEGEHAAISLFVLQKCVGWPNDQRPPEIAVGSKYSQGEGKFDALIEVFRDTFLEPLYEYIDEQLDDQRALLALLRRYKHKCEWFRRDALLALWQSNTGKGERLLANDLYEYLHDQGLEFAIEPSSASGKPDLISAQVGDERLIADAKVFKDGTPKAYLAGGFHQIYQYTLDYNQPFGYLVIFKTCEDDLKFPMSDQEQSIPFLVHNNKTVFFVVIDICQHDTTASKRGVLKTIEITEADLIQKAEFDQRQTP